ncbi:hypothetical protein [Caulobacter sp. 17J65-9]|uniref:hypothetical protein n=1 Tax=Caulobacter sp. 17J65-9 TaxID=2709382 RepID=UPI0013C5F13E|nr:hypothetical protein [Caulobacter sp. 17J65-9]NEX92698.1 hypothetical protein [Caulobacter sp. 17J65-9]
MYRLLLDCTRTDYDADTGYAGFITLKFEEAGDRELAIATAIKKTKFQMAAKGFTPDEIEAFRFEVEEIELVDPARVDCSVEAGFAYY